MTTANATGPIIPQDTAEEPIEGLPAGFGEGLLGRAAFWIAFTFSLFQLWTAAYGTLPSQVVRAMHVGFLLLLGFALVGNLVAKTRRRTAWFWTLGILGFLTGLYNWVFYVDLIQRSGFHTPVDIVVGTLVIVLVFEGRAADHGTAADNHRRHLPRLLLLRQLPARALYPSRLRFRADRRAFRLRHRSIYGTPIYVSAAYIFIFVVFAAFLERAGMLALFNDFALGLVGSWRAGLLRSASCRRR